MPLYFNSKDKNIQRIVERCKTLHESYNPPWWCSSPLINVMISLLKDSFTSYMKLERETIICPDGGEISLDWGNDERTKSLPEDAPILGILHTITGSSSDYHCLMSYAACRGWRPCVLNRRGHSGMTLKVVPHFSILGNVDDTTLMVDQIRRQYPDNFIGIAGFSAGSGQVGLYIGKQEDMVKINAAACMGPAWDISISCQVLQQKLPWFDKFCTRRVQDLYLKPLKNQPALLSMPEVVKKAWTAQNLEEWMNFSAPLAGCKDLEHYYKENNPMEVCSGNKVPCIVMNALDDPICPKECISYDLMFNLTNYVFKVTDHGSHVAYNEGNFAQNNFMYRIILDFFDAVIEENKRHEHAS